MPAFMYAGWNTSGLNNALYSDNQPHVCMTGPAGVIDLDGWDELEVPLPRTRRAFLAVFRRVGGAGTKLHIADPRGVEHDTYYILRQDGRHDATSDVITAERFYSIEEGSPCGVGVDRLDDFFAIWRSGAKLVRHGDTLAYYAVEFRPETDLPALIERLPGLPNITQLQFQGCRLDDALLRRVLKVASNLTGIGLDGTDVTEDGLKMLATLPRITHVEFRGEIYDRERLNALTTPERNSSGVPSD
ncbi:MAG: hypothetical protein QM811_25840 [Pirellulales bacterium]